MIGVDEDATKRVLCAPESALPMMRTGNYPTARQLPLSPVPRTSTAHLHPPSEDEPHQSIQGPKATVSSAGNLPPPSNFLLHARMIYYGCSNSLLVKTTVVFPHSASNLEVLGICLCSPMK